LNKPAGYINKKAEKGEQNNWKCGNNFVYPAFPPVPVFPNITCGISGIISPEANILEN